MPLTLVLGPANSAKAGEVLGAYGAAAQRGALLIVPTAPDARHYSRELAEQGCVLASVLTFAGLAEEIGRRAGYYERRLTRIQRERALDRAVEAARLEVLREAAATGGFAAAAGELVAELERAMVAPARFAQAMRKWGEEDPRRAGLARDISALYLAYADELGRLVRVDPELFLWRALDALRAAPAAWGATPVFFYGFDDLTALERDAVETLSRVVGAEVTVSLTYEAGKAAVRARAGLVEDLRPLAETVTQLPAVDDYYQAGSRLALHHLERSLFEPAPPDPIDPGGAVRLLEAAGERAEAELVAAEVLSLIREGIAAPEIAVVYRSLASVGPLVADVLTAYGIPVALERRVPFGHTALGRGVLALARLSLLPEQEATAADVLAYLRTPGVLERPEKGDALEAEALRERLTTAAQARERLGFDLSEVDALREARDPRTQLLRHARRLLARPYRHDAPLLTAEQAIDAHALTAMARALGELDEVGEHLSGAELIELLEGVEVDASSGAPDSVIVAEPLAIRARRFRAVFVCGLQEGEFPRLAAPDPFLPDERRRELASSSGLVLPMVEEALDRERYLFYAAVSRATDRVVLSYRSSDEEGNLELPSPFVADVAELLDADWRRRRRKRLLGDLVWPLGEAPTDRERARSEAVAGQARCAGEPLTRELGPVALAHVRHTRVVSAGALESYSDCAFKWLVESELDPRTLEPEPDPLARGSYIHAVLEQLLTRLGTALTPNSLPRALELLEELTAELPAEIAVGRPERLREAIAEAIAADLRRYLAREAAGASTWEPRHLELRFGFQDEEQASLPALALDGHVALRGVIDRVDVDPSGRRAVVRDYKSGGQRQEWAGNRWRGDGTLQVPLYMLAVSELLGLEPVAGLYQPLGGGGGLRARGVYLEGSPVAGDLVSTDARDPDALTSELDDARLRAVEVAARLRSGELTACPETCSRNGCLYPGICRST